MFAKLFQGKQVVNQSKVPQRKDDRSPLGSLSSRI